MNEQPERVVLYDGCCGEPVAWMRYGDPIIGYRAIPVGETGWDHTQWTRVLTSAEAIEQYGPVTELVVGISGGRRSVTYGTTKFTTNFADVYPADKDVHVEPIVDDPVTQYVVCPRCGAAEGEHCEGVATRHRARNEAFTARYSSVGRY